MVGRRHFSQPPVGYELADNIRPQLVEPAVATGWLRQPRYEADRAEGHTYSRMAGQPASRRIELKRFQPRQLAAAGQY